VIETSTPGSPHLHKQVCHDDEGRMTVITLKYNHTAVHSGALL
jgi:hypothetical protein